MPENRPGVRAMTNRLLKILFIASLFSSEALADTPPSLKSNARIYDYQDNPITSTVVGPKRGLSVNVENLTLGVTQSGSWTTGRTWNLLNTTDSVNVGNFPATQAVTQSGTWSLGINNFPASFGATQSGTWTVGLSAGANTIGKVDQGVGGASAWKVDGSAVTQPISGTITANAGTGTFLTDGSAHTQPISAASLPLPTGASTSANQTTANTSLSSIDGKLTTTANGLKVDGSAVTQPVSGSLTVSGTVAATQSGAWTTGRTWSLLNTTDSVNAVQSGTWSTGRTWTLSNGTDSIAAAQSGTWNITNITGTVSLPTGAATSALQTTGNSSLSSIDGKLTTSVNGLKTDGSGVTQPVSGTITANAGTGTFTVGQSSGANLHVNVDSAPTTTVTGTVAATQSGTWSNRITDGTNTAAVSASNALKVDGSAVTQPVSGSVSVSNFPATQAVTQSTSPWVVSSAQLPTTLGAKTTANSTAVNIASDQTVPISAASLPLPSGASTAANQTTGNTSLSSIDTKTLTAGQKTMANSYPVVISSDQSAVPASQSGTWNINNVSGTVSLPTGAATSANQTGGGQKTQVVDGANATVGPVQTISGTNYLPVVLSSSATPGSAIPSRAVLTAGSDGTNARAISTDTSGNQNVNIVSTTTAARTSVALARNVYSTTNVTTAAYTQLIASTSNTINQLYIFDSSGQTLVIATGAAASEVDQAYIVPGGNGILNLTIASGTRVSVKAVSATATSGELNITFLK